MDEAVRRRAAAEAVRLAGALSWWWLLRGRLYEARGALAAVAAAVPDSAEARVLHAAFALLTGERPAGADIAAVRDGRAAWLYAYGLFHIGEPGASEKANARARELFTEDGDPWGTAAALGLQAMLALVRGDLAAIAADGPRSAALFREIGDRWGELQTVAPLAVLAEIKGDYAAAERGQHEGLRIARELGLQNEVAARLSGLGRLALLAHDWERARDLHERARRMAAEQGYRYVETHALMGLALGARRSGDLDAAAAHLARIRDEYESSMIGEHLLLAEFGFTAELRGDGPEAAAYHRRALEIARTLADPRAVALSLEGLAGALVLTGDAAGAARLLGAADAARRGAGAPLPEAERGDVDRITAAATAVLGEEAFAAAFRGGADTPATAY
ncbi:hypothetical protein [Actinomadura sp. 21ATH]|uniref:hypothetical protein n=1 Tax=Actinomadura sp. 21ATH TaxID=1735444 RepID=UPI0035BFF52A